MQTTELLVILLVESVAIPNSVTYIDYDAFYNCTNLVTLNFPSKMSSFNGIYLYKCTNLANIKLPDSATYVSLSLSGCNVKNRTIPAKVTSCNIEFNENLQTLRLEAKIVDIADYFYSFSNIPSTVKIQVPKESLTQYKKLCSEYLIPIVGY